MTDPPKLCDVIKLLLDNSLLECYIFKDIEYPELMELCLDSGIGLDEYVLIPVDTGTLLSKNTFYETGWNKKLTLLSPRSKCLQLAMQGLPIECIPHINPHENTTILVMIEYLGKHVLFTIECNLDKIEIIKINLSKWISLVEEKTGIKLFII